VRSRLGGGELTELRSGARRIAQARCAVEQQQRSRMLRGLRTIVRFAAPAAAGLLSSSEAMRINWKSTRLAAVNCPQALPRPR